MKKLKLALETLRVDSFATIAARVPARGTVAGHELLLMTMEPATPMCTGPSGCSSCEPPTSGPTIDCHPFEQYQGQ